MIDEDHARWPPPFVGTEDDVTIVKKLVVQERRITV